MYSPEQSAYKLLQLDNDKSQSMGILELDNLVQKVIGLGKMKDAVAVVVGKYIHTNQQLR
jgi:hypothetical protein